MLEQNIYIILRGQKRFYDSDTLKLPYLERFRRYVLNIVIIIIIILSGAVVLSSLMRILPLRQSALWVDLSCAQGSFACTRFAWINE